MNITITLPESYGIASRDTGVNVALDKLSAEIIAKLALHGLTQKVSDSAASALADAGFEGLRYKDLTEENKAKVGEHAKTAMLATVESLIKGEWSERRAAESVDPTTARVRVLFGALLREDAKDVWATVKGLEAAERGKRLDELFATQDDDFRKAMTDEANAQLKAEAKAKERVGKLKVGIKLPGVETAAE